MSHSFFSEVTTHGQEEYIFFPARGENMKFSVRAQHDADIAFASGANESEILCEIIIGGSGNQYTTIRSNETKMYENKKYTPKILTNNDFRGFWVKWSGGNLTLGLEDERDPFLSSSVPNLSKLSYFGIRTLGVNGTWHIKEAPRTMTMRGDIMRKQLLQDDENYELLRKDQDNWDKVVEKLEELRKIPNVLQV
ncbi:hypothetical protein QAD02_011976 [Eretmocerus hayati]|uniref:Uncharacterized protein n=1 Tax=Eretmocerus hayati TaxID=131215 RepID=A0ACC2NYB7_9HYME|nr:hypothetical protein QAD02_011976 [Eretmocerus hayati]